MVLSVRPHADADALTYRQTEREAQGRKKGGRRRYIREKLTGTHEQADRPPERERDGGVGGRGGGQ